MQALQAVSARHTNSRERQWWLTGSSLSLFISAFAHLLDRDHIPEDGWFRGTLLFAQICCLVAAYVRRPRATIGADGVALKGGLFVALTEIVSHERSRNNALILRIAQRPQIVLAVAPQDWPMTEQLLEGATRQRAVRIGARDSELGAWLLAAPPEADGYRVAALDRDYLVRLAVDPYAAPSARVAACTRLASAGDGDERRGLQASLAATAHPAVRKALEGALEVARVQGRVSADRGTAAANEQDDDREGRRWTAL